MIIEAFNAEAKFSQEEIEFEIESGVKRTHDSSEPSCIRIGTRILNYRWNVCRYFVVDVRWYSRLRFEVEYRYWNVTERK